VPALSNEWFSATPTGLVVRHEDVPFEIWEEYGKGLARVEAALQWVIGDWVNYGEERYGDRFSQALEIWPGVENESVRVYAWVANRAVTRVTSLSWTHHRLVASMEYEDQERWLKDAERENWSCRQLREQIAAERPELDASLMTLIRGSLRQATEAVAKAEGELKAMLVTVVETLRDAQEMLGS